MADVNKTVDIQVKADMKQLLDEFKRMPGITGAEAKKMVASLSRELKQAEKAAAEAAKANQQNMKKIGQSAKLASREIRGMQRSTREMGNALRATGDLVGEVDPALGGMVATLGIAGSAIRDLGKALLTGNPYILGLVGALAAGAAAYSYFTAEAKATEDAQKALNDAVKNAVEAFEAQRRATSATESALAGQKDAVSDLQLEYGHLTGQFSDLDIEYKNIDKRSKAMVKGLSDTFAQQQAQTKASIEAQEKVVEAHEKSIELMKQQGKATDENGDATVDFQIAQIGLNQAIEKQGQLIAQSMIAEQQFLDEVAKEQVEYEETAKAIAKLKDDEKKRREAERNASKAASAQRKKEADEKREQAKKDRDAAIEQAKIEQQVQSIRQVGESALQNAQSISLQNQQKSISMIDDNIERLDAQYQVDQQINADKITALEAIKASNLETAASEQAIAEAKLANAKVDQEISAVQESMHLREMENAENRLEALKAERLARLQLIGTIVGQASQGASAISAIIKNTNEENKEAAIIAFNIQKAASLANVAVLTAEKVMQVAPNPIAMAGVGILGALQAGAIASQPAPEFHMGGIIGKGEDTRNITVLEGEAVLSRRGVKSIGGEQGVNTLNRGKAPSRPEPIIMNPFKHFDRYVHANVQRGGYMATVANRKASGGY